MVRCWVNFYRTYLGVPFALSGGTIEVRSARDEDRAVKAAKRKFARRFGVDDWSMLADDFEVVCRRPE